MLIRRCLPGFVSVAATATLSMLPATGRAQEASPPPAAAVSPPAPAKILPPITMELKDAPVREALLQLFTKANVPYSIDPRVAGYVTLKIEDQPFESALRLILRSTAVPLRYSVQEGGVYLVDPRPPAQTPLMPLPEPMVAANAPNPRKFAVIQTTYLDMFDVAELLGIDYQVIFMLRGEPIYRANGMSFPRIPSRNSGGGGSGFGGYAPTTAPTAPSGGPATIR